MTADGYTVSSTASTYIGLGVTVCAECAPARWDGRLYLPGAKPRKSPQLIEARAVQAGKRRRRWT